MNQKRWWLGLAVVLLMLAAFVGWCGESEEEEVDDWAVGEVDEGADEVVQEPGDVPEPETDSEMVQAPEEVVGLREEEQAWADEEEEVEEGGQVFGADDVEPAEEESEGAQSEEEARQERRERIVQEARERGMEVGIGNDEEREEVQDGGENVEGEEGVDEEVGEEGAWDEWADEDAMESDPSLREDDGVQEALEDLEADMRREGDEGGADMKASEARESVSGDALSTYQDHLDEAWEAEGGEGFMDAATAGLAESLYTLSTATAMPRPQAARQRDQILGGSPSGGGGGVPVGNGVVDDGAVDDGASQAEEDTPEEEEGEEVTEDGGLPEEGDVPRSEEEITESEWTVWLDAMDWLAEIQEENYPQLEEWMVDVEDAALRIEEQRDAEEQMDALMDFFEAVEALLEAMVEEDRDVESAA